MCSVLSQARSVVRSPMPFVIIIGRGPVSSQYLRNRAGSVNGARNTEAQKCKSWNFHGAVENVRSKDVKPYER